MAGSDLSGDGSAAFPWASMQRAAAAVAKMDCNDHNVNLMMGPGVYTGDVSFPPRCELAVVNDGATAAVIIENATVSCHNRRTWPLVHLNNTWKPLKPPAE